jgi:4-hydroxy-3-polyprenylbenzoate decarboxylase
VLVAFDDLRDFIAVLEKRGCLKRITQPVDCQLEIAEITDRVSKLKDRSSNVALLFENVKGYNIPVLTNAFGSNERMALALGVNSLEDIADQIRRLFKSMSGGIHGLRDFLSFAAAARRVMNFPKYVNKAPCKEVIVRDPSLNDFPILKCWPGDGGRFITLPLVFTRNPQTGRQNAGMYRMQVYDRQTTGMHWHMHKDGAANYRMARERGLERLEVAVAIGVDPAVVYAATAPLPPEIDEILFAGFLRRQPVEMVKGETVDIYVPANAEIVLEGYVKTNELRLEGPFGDHTGYYSEQAEYPVFHLTCVTHRQHPIYMATVVGRPPMEDCYLAKASERIFLPFLQQLLPEIVDINLPLEGVFHNCVVVSIRKTYPQQAKKVMYALWGLGQMMFAKMIIVVDAHVDVGNMSEVWWRVYNNTDARRDLVVVDGPLDALDHSSPQPYWGAKLGIDATRAWVEEGHSRIWPDEIVMAEEVRQAVDAKWKNLGLD